MCVLVPFMLALLGLGATVFLAQKLWIVLATVLLIGGLSAGAFWLYGRAWARARFDLLKTGTDEFWNEAPFSRHKVVDWSLGDSKLSTVG